MKLGFKRLLAYLIDMFIIFIVLFLFDLVVNESKYEDKLKVLNEKYIEEQVSFKEYKDTYINYTHNIDKDNIVRNMFTFVLTIVVFIVVPLKLKQTIGQKVLKIKMNRIDLKSLIIRSIIVNGTLYMLFMFISVYLLNDSLYFIMINFLGFCSILLVIINGFMVLYKKEQIGLTDYLSNTRIEEIK